MSAYAEKAVDALHSAYSTNLPTELATVETEAGLSAGDLTEPIEYLKHRAPLDNRSPLVQIYDDGLEAVEERNGIWIVPCTVVISYYGTPDLAANEQFVRRYLTALMRTVLRDVTLAGEAHLCEFVGAEAARLEGDQSQPRYLYGLGWEPHIHSTL